MTSKTEKSKNNKLRSIKLWITIWSMCIISYIIISNHTAFLAIAEKLCIVPLSYIIANVAQKAIYKEGKNVEQDTGTN